MSLIDTFSKEDRVPVTFTDFFNLVKQAAKYENVMNGVKCDVPHKYIREITTGEKEPEDQKKTEIFGIPLELPEDGKQEQHEADQVPEEAISDEDPPITGEKRE